MTKALAKVEAPEANLLDVIAAKRGKIVDALDAIVQDPKATPSERVAAASTASLLLDKLWVSESKRQEGSKKRRRPPQWVQD